jgi:hypothetical protein
MAHGSAFDNLLQIEDGVLKTAKGPLGYKNISFMALRVVQTHGAGAIAAASGTPIPRELPNAGMIWELDVGNMQAAGDFVDAPAQASAVAVVVDEFDAVRVVEWSQDVRLTTDPID